MPNSPQERKYLRLRNVLSALLTVIVAVGLWASNSSLSSLSTNFAETEQSRSLALDTQRLYEDLLSAETGQRGYLLTSNATYLQPYKEAVTDIPIALAVVAANSDAQGMALLPAIKANVQMKLAELNETIHLFATGHQQEAMNIVYQNTGQAYMDNIRSLIAQINALEAGQIAQRSRSVDSSLNIVRSICSVALALIGFLVVLAYMSLEQYESAAQMKSLFIANLSHEIRTPLNGIVSMTELLAGSHIDAEQADMLTTIRACSQSLLRIIDDILLLSKIEAGKFTLAPQPSDLNDFVHILSRIFDARCRSKNIDFVCEVSPDVPRYLVFDAVRLRQVLGNLLDNAVKFTHKGRVCLTIQRTTIQTQPDTNHISAPTSTTPLAASSDAVVVDVADGKTQSPIKQAHAHAQTHSHTPTKALAASSNAQSAAAGSSLQSDSNSVSLFFRVSDTGIGIPREAQSSIGLPFAQADMSSTRRYGGTGLGVSICFQLVQLMGGQLTFTSEEGKGTTFQFSIPLPLASAASVAVSPFAASASAALSVPEADALSGSAAASASIPASVPVAEHLSGLHVSPLDATQAAATTTATIGSDTALNLSLNLQGVVRWHENPANAAITAQTDHDSARSTTSLASTLSSSSVPSAASTPDFAATRTRTHAHEHTLAHTYSHPQVSSSTHPHTPAPAPASITTTTSTPRTTTAAASASASSEPVSAGTGFPRSPSPPNALRDLPRLSILLAEDNKVNQKVMIKWLGKAGHQVIIAQNGQEAVDLFTAQPKQFDCVIMDVHMPVMDGLTAVRNIRKFEQSQQQLHSPPAATTTAATAAKSAPRSRANSATTSSIQLQPLSAASVSVFASASASAPAQTTPRAQTQTQIQSPTQQTHPLTHVPIIALTASALDEDRQKCLEAGVDDFMSKPVDWHEFSRKLASLLKRSPATATGAAALAAAVAVPGSSAAQ